MIGRIFLSAGHIEEGETPEDAVLREIKEETGIDVLKYELLAHEFIEWNECKRGGKGHDWFLFEIVKWEGELKNNNEAKNIGWFSPEEIKSMQLEEAWKYWFEKIGLK